MRPLMLFLGFMLWGAPWRGWAQPRQDTSQLERVASAAIGTWAYRSGAPLRIVPRRSVFYPDVKFYRAEVSGDHDLLVGLVVEVPGYGLMPLASPSVRRLLTPYAQVNTADTAAVVEYGLELAQLDGVVPPDAMLIRARGDLPAGLRDAELQGPFAPRARWTKDLAVEVVFLALVSRPARRLYRVHVWLRDDRWNDTSYAEAILDLF